MNRHFYVLLFLLCGVLMSCESIRTPMQVSEHFWLGIKTKNIALVKKYSLADSIDETEDLSSLENVTSISFGKIIIDGDYSEIETTLTVSVNEKKVDIKLKTYLKNNNDVWKVDYQKTVLQLIVNQNMAEVFGDIEKMTAEVTEQIEESVKEIKEKVVPEIKSEIEDIQDKVLPEINSKIEQAEEKLLEKLPEFKNIFDKFLRELEKSLEELMPVEEEAKTQET